MTDDQIYDIHTKVRRIFCNRIPYELDIPNEKIYIIHVTDYENKYVNLPDGMRKIEWLESIPLKAIYYCSKDEVEQICQFFNENHCIIAECKEIIVPEHTYEKDVTCHVQNSVARLFTENLDSISFKCRYLLKDVPSPLDQTVIPVKIVDLPRFADAYYNFKNVSSININNVIYNPDVFTPDHRLSLHGYSSCYIEATDMTVPVEFDACLYSHQMRINLDKL